MIATSTLPATPHDVAGHIRESVARLMTVRSAGDGFRVSVPVLFPSGATSVVEVIPGRETAFVSDMGVGHLEAEFGGAAAYYDTQARRVAEQFGIAYDGFSIFAVHLPLSRIEGGISSVANASVRAASAALQKASEEKDRSQNEALFDRITRVFGRTHVSKSAELRGARDTWSAHNVVLFPSGEKAVFEFVSPHRNSISNKFFMFSDLANSPESLALNAVVERRRVMPSAAAMMEDVGNIIEIDADDEQFRRYAHLRAT